MKWVTRRRPKIDRIACPWLILRFVDPAAKFLFVAPEEVNRVATEGPAIPFDVEGVELSHVGPLCSFDALLLKYQLTDPALEQLARIVRGADTAELGLTPHSEIDGWIKKALDGSKEWVLIGGPPCQAYSMAGRSRMRPGDSEWRGEASFWVAASRRRVASTCSTRSLRRWLRVSMACLMVAMEASEAVGERASSSWCQRSKLARC